MFHLNHGENDKYISLLESHYKSSKTRSGSLLDLEFFFVKKFIYTFDTVYLNGFKLNLSRKSPINLFLDKYPVWFWCMLVHASQMVISSEEHQFRFI